jgi:hypothetical protein
MAAVVTATKVTMVAAIVLAIVVLELCAVVSAVVAVAAAAAVGTHVYVCVGCYSGFCGGFRNSFRLESGVLKCDNLFG